MSRRHGGTGLGLAITKMIINSMKGDIECISEGNDKGTIFRVQMPATRLAPTQIPRNSIPSETVANVSNIRMRLCLQHGPSRTSVLDTLEGWGIAVKDFSFEGMLPPSSNIAKLMDHMKKDDAEGLGLQLPSSNNLEAILQGKGLRRTVYLVDSCVWQGLLTAGAKGEMLSRTLGLVLGFLDEQDKISKDLRAHSGWSSLVRPIKKASLREKIAASALPASRAMASSAPSKQPGTPSSCGSDAHAHKPLQSQEGSGEDSRSKPLVLLVDDHAVNQRVALRMIQKILGSGNVDVHIANDGFEAVTMVTKSKSRPYDLVLMDVQMPCCDGLEATRRIRAWEYEVRLFEGEDLRIGGLTIHA